MNSGQTVAGGRRAGAGAEEVKALFAVVAWY